MTQNETWVRTSFLFLQPITLVLVRDNSSCTQGSRVANMFKINVIGIDDIFDVIYRFLDWLAIMGNFIKNPCVRSVFSGWHVSKLHLPISLLCRSPIAHFMGILWVILEMKRLDVWLWHSLSVFYLFIYSLCNNAFSSSTIQCQMEGWYMINELESMLKEGVMV